MFTAHIRSPVVNASFKVEVPAFGAAMNLTAQSRNATSTRFAASVGPRILTLKPEQTDELKWILMPALVVCALHYHICYPRLVHAACKTSIG